MKNIMDYASEVVKGTDRLFNYGIMANDPIDYGISLKILDIAAKMQIAEALDDIGGAAWNLHDTGLGVNVNITVEGENE